MRFRVVRVDGDLLELQTLEGEIEEFRAQDEVELTMIRSRVWSKGYAKGYRDGLDHGKRESDHGGNLTLPDGIASKAYADGYEAGILQVREIRQFREDYVAPKVRQKERAAHGVSGVGHYGNLVVTDKVTLSLRPSAPAADRNAIADVRKTCDRRRSEEDFFDPALLEDAKRENLVTDVMLDTAANTRASLEKGARELEDRNATAEDG